jgi:hypothetical protein
MVVAFLIARKYHRVLRRFTPKDSIAYDCLNPRATLNGVVGLRCSTEQMEELIEIAKKRCPEALPQLQEALDFSSEDST